MYNKFIDMLTILGTTGILILVCLFSVLHLQIGPPMVEATPFQVQPVSKGGTGATTAATARTNLGALAEELSVALSSDDTYDGLTSVHNAGDTIPQWHPVFLDPNDADNEWQKADADVSGDAPAEGITVEACSNGAACTVLLNGYFRNDGFQGVWTDGQLLYLSDDVVSCVDCTDCTDDDCYGWTDTAPSTQYDVVQPIGRVRDNGSTCIIRVNINGVTDWGTVP